MDFTTAELHIITSALHVAADQYRQDAAFADAQAERSKANGEADAGHRRTATQFRRQQAEANALAERIEQEAV